MPSPTQIIPEFAHPHDIVVVNDNTQYQEVVAAPVEGVIGLFLFASEEGEDNKAKLMGSVSDYTTEYGQPNFRKYGQAPFMPYNFLSSGQAFAYCMRVMPDDATAANAVVLAKVKVDPSNGATPTPTLSIYFEVASIADVTDRSTLSDIAEGLLDLDPDANGYATYPLFAIVTKGRGEAGNKFRFRITQSIQADRETGFKNYRLEVYKLQNGTLQRRGVHEGSPRYDAVMGTSSMFLEDVVNDPSTGSSAVEFFVKEDSFRAIYDLYAAEVNDVNPVAYESFDMLYGRTPEGATIPGINFVTGMTDSVSLDSPTAMGMMNGHDGAFADPDPSVRELALADAYVRAFNGEFDKSIRSKYRTPAAFVFDANYPHEVKLALADLVIKRKDIFGFLDAGILSQPSDAIAWGEQMEAIGAWQISKDCMSYKTRDPFTGKIMQVTATYDLCRRIPSHIMAAGVGSQTPLAGPQTTTLTGHVPGSVTPVIDSDDSDIKEALYNLRVNYYEASGATSFFRGTHLTSQPIWSDLSRTNNALITLELKREFETLNRSFRFNLAEASERAKFTAIGRDILSKYIGVKIREGSVYFDMNQFEEIRSILHCYVAIVLQTYSERTITEIDINPRA